MPIPTPPTPPMLLLIWSENMSRQPSVWIFMAAFKEKKGGDEKKVEKKRIWENKATIKRNLLFGETEHSKTTTNDSRKAARVRNIFA